MEEFVAGLAVECPRLCYRDVVDAAQVGGWVGLCTRSGMGVEAGVGRGGPRQAEAWGVHAADASRVRGSRAGPAAAACPALPLHHFRARRPRPAPPQAAQHVRSLTAAIATRRHKASDATTFLEMQVKNGSTVSAGVVWAGRQAGGGARGEEHACLGCPAPSARTDNCACPAPLAPLPTGHDQPVP